MVIAFQVVLLIVIIFSGLVGVGHDKAAGMKGLTICISSVAAFMATLWWL